MTETPSRTDAERHQAEQMRMQRQEIAGRVWRLRAGMAQGHAQAERHLRTYRLMGAPCPNPDRRSSCLEHVARVVRALAQLDQCRHRPELLGIPDMIRDTQERHDLLTRLADTARY